MIQKGQLWKKKFKQWW